MPSLVHSFGFWAVLQSSVPPTAVGQQEWLLALTLAATGIVPALSDQTTEFVSATYSASYGAALPVIVLSVTVQLTSCA